MPKRARSIPESELSPIAHRIRAAAAIHGVRTATELQAKLNVGRQVAWKWWTGATRHFLAEDIKLISSKLGVRMTWLMDGSGPMGINELLTPDESVLLELWRRMPEDIRDQWVEIGKRLAPRGPPDPRPRAEQRQIER